MRFVANEHGRYVKEKMAVIRNQIEEKQTYKNKKCNKGKITMKAKVNNTTVEGFTKREVERA